MHRCLTTSGSQFYRWPATLKRSIDNYITLRIRQLGAASDSSGNSGNYALGLQRLQMLSDCRDRGDVKSMKCFRFRVIFGNFG